MNPQKKRNNRVNPTGKSNFSSYELHSHLYGCLTIEDLYWLAARNQPRWEIFQNSYFNYYKKKPEIEKLFQSDPMGDKLLQRYYHLEQPDCFQAFQVCFDLVISLSRTDPDELQEIVQRIVSRDPPSGYAEYRMMFSPFLSIDEFTAKVATLCEAFERADQTGTGTARAVLSLSRNNERNRQEYAAVKKLQLTNPAAARYLAGLDFCGYEEGHPPHLKKEIFQTILKDNAAHPAQALAILYHVGESYQDKSIESAIRWVIESARLGAHRLGHAIALAVNPLLYADSTRQESAAERLDQIAFELEHAETLRVDGYPVDVEQALREQEELQKKAPDEQISIHYDQGRIRRLRVFQDWGMREVKKTGAVVECCPTSNLRIANLRSPENHPLLRFLEHELPVVIGADDPGILNVTLDSEFELIRSWAGVTEGHVVRLKETAALSSSGILSGRISVGF